MGRQPVRYVNALRSGIPPWCRRTETRTRQTSLPGVINPAPKAVYLKQTNVVFWAQFATAPYLKLAKFCRLATSRHLKIRKVACRRYIQKEAQCHRRQTRRGVNLIFLQVK